DVAAVTFSYGAALAGTYAGDAPKGARRGQHRT
ncbi:MAG: hypothetical protein QOI52_2025, partial [Chloroflexota bacterium]|nr:hypothetical protein [Chloroflexota bacterium]